MVDKQELVRKYTKLVMKKLANKEIYVFFRDCGGFRAIFRPKEINPYTESYEDIEKYKRNPLDSITFNDKYYKKDELDPNIWWTIVHEASHYEIGVSGGSYQETYHSKEFIELQKKNLELVEDLRDEFDKEVNWKEQPDCEEIDFGCVDDNEFEEIMNEEEGYYIMLATRVLIILASKLGVPTKYNQEIKLNKKLIEWTNEELYKRLIADPEETLKIMELASLDLYQPFNYKIKLID